MQISMILKLRKNICCAAFLINRGGGRYKYFKEFMSISWENLSKVRMIILTLLEYFLTVLINLCNIDIVLVYNIAAPNCGLKIIIS